MPGSSTSQAAGLEALAILARHTWRLMTFRHTLKGLNPRRFDTLVLVILLSSIVHAVAGGGNGFTHGLVLLLVSSVSPRICLAFALLSLGLNLVFLPLDLLESSFSVRPHSDMLHRLWLGGGMLAVIVHSIFHPPS